MNYTIVDVGSNTIKMTIYDENGNALLSKSESARLLSFAKDGIMSSDGITVLEKCLIKFQKISQEQDASVFSAFATASLRGMKNSSEVIKQIEKTINIKIDLLSEEQEALYSFIGNKNTGSGIYADMGGGSTELVIFNNSCAQEHTSLPFGSLSLSLKFSDRMTQRELVKEYVTNLCNQKFDRTPSNNRLRIAGGSIKALATVYCAYYSINTQEGFPGFSYSQIEIFSKLLYADNQELSDIIQSKAPERAALIAPACAALSALMEYYKLETVEIALGGIREGYLIKLLKGQI